jgi:hypothetical protein
MENIILNNEQKTKEIETLKESVLKSDFANKEKLIASIKQKETNKVVFK